MVKDGQCYTVLEDPSSHLGIRYIVLKEGHLSAEIRALRMKIIGYLILSFIFMGIVGYFLARLFLAPVRNKIEALDRFISDTTHELNTPVSAILMTIQTLKGCDSRKLKRLEASAVRLIDNLLSNAIKYSDPGGMITVVIEGKNLIVADEGIGIDKAVQKDIFKRYKRANKERGGFDIGLDIVLTICKRYGIKIDLESEKGKEAGLYSFFLERTSNIQGY